MKIYSVLKMHLDGEYSYWGNNEYSLLKSFACKSEAREFMKRECDKMIEEEIDSWCYPAFLFESMKEFCGYDGKTLESMGDWVATAENSSGVLMILESELVEK